MEIEIELTCTCEHKEQLIHLLPVEEKLGEHTIAIPCSACGKYREKSYMIDVKLNGYIPSEEETVLRYSR
jgi:hypothetical protein